MSLKQLNFTPAQASDALMAYKEGHIHPDKSSMDKATARGAAQPMLVSPLSTAHTPVSGV